MRCDGGETPEVCHVVIVQDGVGAGISIFQTQDAGEKELKQGNTYLGTYLVRRFCPF